MIQIWGLLGIIFALIFAPTSTLADPNEFVVYGVNHSVNLGNTNEPTRKDFYVNMGTNQGLRIGSYLDVLRKAATYDVIGKKLYKDMIYPIAKLKVIHVEENAAIARLDKILPDDETPNATPHAVIVGDLVRVTKAR